MKTNWEKEFEKLLSKYESYAPTWVFNFISKQLQQAKQEGIEASLELVKHDEKHAPKSPQDITITQQGGWYLGRIDGLQSVETKLEAKLSELKKKEGI